MENLHVANLAFLLSYGDGTSNDEIEYEIYKLAFEKKGTTHYNRRMGGSFEDLEQENSNASEVLMMTFSTNMVESLYYVNEARGFNPYIIMGYSDIETEIDGTTYYVNAKYRLLKDLNTEGKVEIAL